MAGDITQSAGNISNLNMMGKMFFLYILRVFVSFLYLCDPSDANTKYVPSKMAAELAEFLPWVGEEPIRTQDYCTQSGAQY